MRERESYVSVICTYQSYFSVALLVTIERTHMYRSPSHSDTVTSPTREGHTHTGCDDVWEGNQACDFPSFTLITSYIIGKSIFSSSPLC